MCIGPTYWSHSIAWWSQPEFTENHCRIPQKSIHVGLACGHSFVMVKWSWYCHKKQPKLAHLWRCWQSLSRTAELLIPTLDSKPEEVVPSVPVYYSDIQETVQSFRVSQQHIQPSIFLRRLTFVKLGNPYVRTGGKCSPIKIFDEAKSASLVWVGKVIPLPCFARGKAISSRTNIFYKHWLRLSLHSYTPALHKLGFFNLLKYLS